MKTFLITGGCGFIGHHLVRHIASKGHNAVVLDAWTYAAVDDFSDLNNINYIKLDIRNKEELDKLAESLTSKNLTYDAVFHLAAESHVDNSLKNPQLFIETNVLGTLNMLEFHKKVAPTTPFIYQSTDEVFGSSSSTKDSNAALVPTNPYSASKASGELLVESYRRTYGLTTHIVRACNNYGEGQSKEKLIPTIIYNLTQKIPVPVYDNGAATREWVYAGEYVKKLFQAYDEKGLGVKTNIIRGPEISVIGLIQEVAKLLDISEYTVKHIHGARPGMDTCYRMNTLYSMGKDIFDLTLAKTVSHYVLNGFSHPNNRLHTI